MAEHPDDRILSIQSHVVSGYVGNKSATFPLQLLGFEVDAINSVQFSNHTGYPGGIRGQVLDDSQLWELVEGLQTNGIDRYSHVINGYIGSRSFLLKLAEVVRAMKARNPDLVYVCDPVMGDTDQGMYVPEELVPVYRSTIVPLSDICLPNQFEAEKLTGRTITSEADAIDVMTDIHDMGVAIVVLSSTELGDADSMIGYASQRSSTAAGEAETRVTKIRIPKVPANFVGTGDLFTALFTAWLRRSGGVRPALERTIATMQAVLKRTFERAMKVKPSDTDRPRAQDIELQLIQSKRDIESPVVVIDAHDVR